MNLIIKLQNPDQALGMLVRAWCLAQKWYLTPEKMIPMDVWEKQLFSNALFDVGLAEKINNKVRVSGCDEQFGWLLQRVEAGRLGGIARGKRVLTREEASKRQAARIILAKSVKAGETIKPSHCQECGLEKSIEGHHTSYDNPLDVVWLCKECHVDNHRRIEIAVAKRSLAGPKPPYSSSISKDLNTKPTDVGSLPQLARIWNKKRGRLAEVRLTNAQRNKRAAALWLAGDPNIPPEEYWSEVVKKIADSPFCRGENKPGWRATFDWILKPDTHLKVMEGKYDSSGDNRKVMTHDEFENFLKDQENV